MTRTVARLSILYPSIINQLANSMVIRLKAFFSILKTTYKEWTDDKASRLAAALAYHTAFSIAPLLVIIIGIIGIVVNENTVRADIINNVRAELGVDAAQLVESLIETKSLSSGAGIVSTIIGFGALLLGATGVFSNLQGALDTIWNVDEIKPSGGIKGMVKDKLLSFGMLLIIGFLLLVSLVLSTILSAVTGYVSGLVPATQIILELISFSMSVGIITLLFALIYKYLPHVDIEWRDVFVGAAVTSLLFTIGKTLLSIYLARSSTASLYGAAGAFVLILLWVYYSAQIILFGAEFTQVFARQYGSKIVPEGYKHEENETEQTLIAPEIKPILDTQSIEKPPAGRMGFAEIIFGVGVLILGLVASRWQGTEDNRI
ncbi:MAG: YihY/virulence factor BrkB family protein [Aggregatilineales bacterium]